MMLLIPHVDRESSSVVCGLWWSREVDVWVRDEGDKTLEYATRLMKAYDLKPRSRARIPDVILNARGLPRPIIGCMEALLTKGSWYHTILPFSAGPQEGFTKQRKRYGRLFLMRFEPGERKDDCALVIQADAFPQHGEDLRTHNAVFSPFTMKRVQGDPGSPVEIAKAIKEKMERAKWSKVRAGTIGKGLWIRTPQTLFKPGYEEQAESLEDGDHVNRELLLDSKAACTGFRWLGHYRNRVLQIPDVERVFPKIVLRHQDFPESVRQADKEFFDQPW